MGGYSRRFGKDWSDFQACGAFRPGFGPDTLATDEPHNSFCCRKVCHPGTHKTRAGWQWNEGDSAAWKPRDQKDRPRRPAEQRPATAGPTIDTPG